MIKKKYTKTIWVFLKICRLLYADNSSKKLIHISPTSVYGKQSKIVDEQCEEKYLKPQSPYAEIKLKEEKTIDQELQKFRNTLL